MTIEDLGWNDFFENQFHIYKEQDLIAGRIIREVRHLYSVYTAEGMVKAEVSGYFHYTAVSKSDYPTVGDWVALRKSGSSACIENVLSRKSSFSRKSAGEETEEQVVAANIDYLCIVCGLDGGRNFNLRGIERYIAMTREGGAEPILLLNKVDLCEDPEHAKLQAMNIAGDISVHLVSAFTGMGINKLCHEFHKASTVAFTGQSGVGKSSLINTLLGNESLKTGELRASDLRGRHTTTHKELFFLEGGAMVIDTPGMRELQLWGSQDSLETTFSEIHNASQHCQFSDCSHQNEPGCAVKQLISNGCLEKERYDNFIEMRAELQFLESKVGKKGRMIRKRKEKELSKIIRKVNKNR